MRTHTVHPDTHTVHPDTHEFGLADRCPRCREHAEEPWAGLDFDLLINLMQRLDAGDSPRSLNEGLAMDAIRTLLRRAAILDNLRTRP